MMMKVILVCFCLILTIESRADIIEVPADGTIQSIEPSDPIWLNQELFDPSHSIYQSARELRLPLVGMDDDKDYFLTIDMPILLNSNGSDRQYTYSQSISCGRKELEKRTVNTNAQKSSYNINFHSHFRFRGSDCGPRKELRIQTKAKSSGLHNYGNMDIGLFEIGQ